MWISRFFSKQIETASDCIRNTGGCNKLKEIWPCEESMNKEKYAYYESGRDMHKEHYLRGYDPRCSF